MCDNTKSASSSGHRCAGRRAWLLLLVVTIAAPAHAGAGADPANQPATGQEESRLMAVVQSNEASYSDRMLACKRLAQIGTGRCVAALAPLLADERLAHGARIALEALPDPAAGAALRGAARRVEGALLVGVVNSLGARRDAEAGGLLRELLTHPDARVKAAAGEALGKIGTAAAAEALLAALPTAPSAVQIALGNGCLQCGARMLRDGQRESAAAVYDRLRELDVPEPIVLAATRGAILCRRPPDAVELLAAELRASDAARFEIGLTVSREMPGTAVTETLLAQLNELGPNRQARLITLLGDRADPAARPAVLEALRSEDPGIRVAAAKALGTLGDVSTVPQLIELAGQGDSPVAAAALDSLSVLAGADVDQAIVDRLREGGPQQRVLVDVAGRRSITAAVPLLAAAAESADDSLRRSALRALGNTIDADRLEVLTGRLGKTDSAEQRATVLESLRVACARLAGDEQCARKLVDCLDRVPAGTRVAVLELLRTVGGAPALRAVTQAAFDPEQAVQDAATRLLGEWRSADAAESLLAVARKSTNETFRIRGLRGYIRIIRQFDVPADDKLEMCRTAMALAWRPNEKLLVVEALGRIPTAAALAAALEYRKQPELRERACLTAVEIGQRLIRTDPERVTRAMQQVLETTKNAETARRARELMGA